MNNTLQLSLQKRWPHDHLLFLWLAPALAIISLNLHVSLPWSRDLLASTLASLALLLLPGALLLQWLTPGSREVVAIHHSPRYRFWYIAGRILTVLALVGFAIGWYYASPLSMSLCLCILSFSLWMPQLQPRILITAEHVWHLGFPIQVELREVDTPDITLTPDTPAAHWETEQEEAALATMNEHHDHDTPPQAAQGSATEEVVLGAPLSRGKWRYGWFGVMWVAWSYSVVSLTLGLDARLPVFWSLRTLILWGLGSLVCLQISRLPPQWRAPRGSRYLWQERSSAWVIFLSLSLSSCLLTLGLTLTSLLRQLFVLPPLQFVARTVFFDLLLTIVALTLLFDPSGIWAWIAKKDDTLYVRRFGWVEVFLRSD